MATGAHSPNPSLPALERARALLFRAELAVRLGKRPLAQSSLSEALAMAVGDAERALIARELDHASDLVAGMA